MISMISRIFEDAVEDLIGLALQALNLPDPDAEDGSQTSSKQGSRDNSDDEGEGLKRPSGLMSQRRLSTAASRRKLSNHSSIGEGSNLLQVSHHLTLNRRFWHPLTGCAT